MQLGWGRKEQDNQLVDSVWSEGSIQQISNWMALDGAVEICPELAKDSNEWWEITPANVPGIHKQLNQRYSWRFSSSPTSGSHENKDLVHTYKSVLSSHKPCSQSILTELLFFFSLYFLSCPSLGARGLLSPILLPINQWCSVWQLKADEMLSTLYYPRFHTEKS